MASHPDNDPDQLGDDTPSSQPEQVSPADDAGRDSVEDSPGTAGGTAGTGGTNHRVDRDITS